MATKKIRTAGTAQLGVEVDSELRDYLARYAKSRDETMREVVERALRWEFNNPPPLPVKQPLPPLPVQDEEKPKKRKDK